MAKKKEESNQAPVISSIPVPPSDSALVIDLPDGQKLLVGKIETGTVIEVATWRGTGRPDSRTNRLMLGMSNENESRAQEQNGAVEVPPLQNMNFPRKALYMARQILANLIPKISKLVTSVKKVDLSKLKSLKFELPKFRKRKPIIGPTVESSFKIEEDFDADFQRILDEVSQRRVAKPDNPNRLASEKAKKSQSSPRSSKKGSAKRKK